MKKIFLAAALFMTAIAGKVSAQPRVSEIIVTKDFALTATGAQTIVFPDGKGELQFDKNGDVFTNVVFIEATGKKKGQRFILSVQYSKLQMQTPCKYPLPDACFATADKSIGMCICKPTDLNSNTYTFTMLLPAIQSVRESANKN